jgi:hypothetical protein
MISTDFYETQYFVVHFFSECLLKNLGPETYKYRSILVIIYCRLIEHCSVYETKVLRLWFFIYPDLTFKYICIGIRLLIKSKSNKRVPIPVLQKRGLHIIS